MALCLVSISFYSTAQDTLSHNVTGERVCKPDSSPSFSKGARNPERGRSADVPPVVHSRIGDKSAGMPGKIRLINIGKFQQFSVYDKSTFDKDISSPKSVTFNSDGTKFYVNSLEGGRTVVYDTDSLHKRDVIRFNFTSADSSLWAPLSGFYPFIHYPGGSSRSFTGKPVESAWSHDGRYLWVPFYRRSFDLNAQDPSAIAVIDTKTDRIIRLMETGPLPKMVAASPDKKWMAVTHWGDNTVGLIDISSPDPAEWRHKPPMAAGHKFNPDYPLDTPVNRDSGSGYLLRGTVFSPDSRFLFVSAMGGPMSVFDVKNGKFIGHINSLYGIRHILIHDGYLYGSMNVAGAVVKVPLSEIIEAVEEALASGNRYIRLRNTVKISKVDSGARTLEISPDGRYLFVACNTASSLCVVDAETLGVVDSIRVDSYPVGLALSPDGRLAIVTSQGRKGFGGNAVNVFSIERPDLQAMTESAQQPDTIITSMTSHPDDELFEPDHQKYFKKRILGILILIGVLIIGAITGWSIMHRRKRNRH